MGYWFKSDHPGGMFQVMETQDTAHTELRLNKHGKPFVRQGFSQLLHTMRLAFNEAWKRETPARIRLEFLDEREDGEFVVLEKPTRKGMDCSARVMRVDSAGLETLTWTPSTEHQILWNGRKREKRVPVVKNKEKPEALLVSDEQAVDQMEKISEVAAVPFVATEVPVAPEPEPVVVLAAVVPFRAVPVTDQFRTKADKMAMIRAAVERSKKARESRESLQALIAAGG